MNPTALTIKTSIKDNGTCSYQHCYDCFTADQYGCEVQCKQNKLRLFHFLNFYLLLKKVLLVLLIL